MDMIDRAQQEIDFASANRCPKEPKREAEETGYCLYCGELVAKGHRWCSVGCRDEWEKEQKKLRRMGRH